MLGMCMLGWGAGSFAGARSSLARSLKILVLISLCVPRSFSKFCTGAKRGSVL